MSLFYWLKNFGLAQVVASLDEFLVISD